MSLSKKIVYINKNTETLKKYCKLYNNMLRYTYKQKSGENHTEFSKNYHAIKQLNNLSNNYKILGGLQLTQKHNRKSIYELSLIDDFLFTEALSHKETAELVTRLILDRALGIKAGNLIIEPQKPVNGIDTDRHGIRMDVSITETADKEDNSSIIRVYDIEPNNIETINLPKRSRYYQALTDVKLLSTGVNYDILPELITIWILPYDPFEKNNMIYFVKNTVEGFDDLYYNDGIRKVFLYTDGKLGGSKELKQLLTYIKNSSTNNATDTQLEQLHSGVEWLKQSSKTGVRYMQMWEIVEHEKKQSRQEGIEEGRINGISKTIEILKEMNISDEKILEQLMRKYELDEKTAKRYIYSLNEQ